ncbi:OmpA family protein [Cryomorpha ignava]|uniref:OmpA family protein n=1 Tax=Cryomorpha ignava TaxID=101383 RepID=A0A7K3WMY7_9FLAO|nr:OmpA family protein [Cryomorpha ignava]NEN22898.1 OmpA family protein [Cryomorpha ignava]
MIKTRKLLFFFAAAIAFLPVSAQDEDPDPDNMVPNGSFENFEGSLRRDEQFDLTKEWGFATDVIPDLFATNIKSRYVSIPENMYGKEDPADGENYAGIVAYSYRSKRSRSYLTVQLKSKMKENNLYCIKYKASLAERSRYASNNMGALITQKKVSEKGTGAIVNSDAIVNDRNAVVSQTDGWWDFCKRYAAKGNEQYLTIGNFATDANTANETREVSSDYEKGPEIAAYYYIDQVEVRRIEANENCGCANTKIPESKVIYSATTQLSDDMTMSEKVDAIDAYFYQYQAEVVSAAERTIDQIVELMKANPMMKIQVIAHSDNEEADLAKKETSLATLAEDRAKNVREYIAAQGVDRTRVLMDNKSNTEPVSKMSTPISLAKNRRVEFKIVF